MLTEQDVVLQKTSTGFDVSGWEIFLPLYSGAKMTILAKGLHRDPFKLIETIKLQKVTTIHFVPTMLNQLMNHIEDIQELESLRHIICSGEALELSLNNRVLALLKAHLYNYYGPTETTIDSTFWKCDILTETKKIPIGSPIDNTQIYILDKNQQPVLQGMIGELYIGGLGVGKGYINQPQLTKACFIPDPFSPYGTLYKTGDLARLNGQNQIEYLGRNDSQIKLYGQRIEIGEIESMLLETPHVAHAKVLLNAGSNDSYQIVGFVVLDKGKSLNQLSEQELINALKVSLPHYMVPSRIVILTEFPYLTNGKVDNRSLLTYLEANEHNISKVNEKRILRHLKTKLLKYFAIHLLLKNLNWMIISFTKVLTPSLRFDLLPI